ncbi:MAG: LytTR family transcriptional regulator [Asticcacaulis sp.]|nr:LytTR family transcriptional regulator [Asticcacaulis sp.]
MIWLGLERLLAGREKQETALPPTTSPVLEVRDGAHTRYVPMADILWAEAAGNYVELHMASGRPLLMRTTLAALAQRLNEAGFVRIHRSRLVNPAAIQAIENLPAGDAVLRLSNGATVSVSRTYRTDIVRQLAARTTTA